MLNRIPKGALKGIRKDIVDGYGGLAALKVFDALTDAYEELDKKDLALVRAKKALADESRDARKVFEELQVVDHVVQELTLETKAQAARIKELEKVLLTLRPTQHDDDCEWNYPAFDLPKTCTCDLHEKRTRIGALLPKEKSDAH